MLAAIHDRVACFIAGSNRWVSASRLEQLEQGSRPFELDATGVVVGAILNVVAERLPASKVGALNIAVGSGNAIEQVVVVS